MLKTKCELRAKNTQMEQLEKWTNSINNPSKTETTTNKKTIPVPILAQTCESFQPEKSELEPWLAEEMDNAISDAFLTGTEDSMTHMLHLILSENVSVDYQVSTFYTFCVE